MPKKQKLNARQQKFIAEYLIDRNATQAAIRAGYSKNGVGQTAHALLKNPEISSAIQNAQEKMLAKFEITRERVVKEMARLAFSDMRKYAKWSEHGIELRSSEELTDDEAAAVAELSETSGKTRTRRFKLHSKDRALEMLAKYFGLFDAEEDPKAAADAIPMQVYYEHPPARLNGVNGH